VEEAAPDVTPPAQRKKRPSSAKARQPRKRMRLEVLRELCEQRELPTDGRKGDLLKRLQDQAATEDAGAASEGAGEPVVFGPPPPSPDGVVAGAAEVVCKAAATDTERDAALEALRHGTRDDDDEFIFETEPLEVVVGDRVMMRCGRYPPRGGEGKGVLGQIVDKKREHHSEESLYEVQFDDALFEPVWLKQSDLIAVF